MVDEGLCFCPACLHGQQMSSASSGDQAAERALDVAMAADLSPKAVGTPSVPGRPMKPCLKA